MKTKVIFIYVGDRIPDYAISSIRLAAKYSNQDVILLANQKALSKVRLYNCITEPIESFYSPLDFQQAQSGLKADVLFRDALWARSLERFFILEQYMRFRVIDSVFHAELDQFLFDTKLLVENLQEIHARGVFAPCHSSRAVVASILYCNDQQSLSEFLRFAKSGVAFSSEMDLLAQWASSQKGNFLELPSVHGFFHDTNGPTIHGSELLSCGQIDGVTDAAEFGQWFGGIDPRNVPIFQAPTNKFVGPSNNSNLSKVELSACKLEFDPLENKLFLNIQHKKPVQIFNLHIHSKIHSNSFLNVSYLQNVIESVNSDEKIRFPGTRRLQLTDFVKSYYRIIFRRVRKFFFKSYFL